MAPEIAVSKGNILFAHPQDARATVAYALQIGSDPSLMKEKPGEVMGYLAYGHPFLDGNGRTTMVVHAELARRAGISIDWAATSKAEYLTALTGEIEKPGAGLLDAYLKPFIRQAVEIDFLVDHIAGTRGLDGSVESAKENKVFGNVTDPEVQISYEKQKLQRRR